MYALTGEKLAKDWEGDKVGLVGEVDCTSELGKPTCELLEIQGFPTLMYGDPANMEEYEGGRSYADLSVFAKENLVPVCSTKNIDLCDDEMKKKVTEYEHLSLDELESLINVEEEKLDAAREAYEQELKRLQELYDKAALAKLEAFASVRHGGMPLMKAVHKAKRTTLSADEL